jgi:ABC-type multidrug transport system fused ATPase/permease subunit
VRRRRAGQGSDALVMLRLLAANHRWMTVGFIAAALTSGFLESAILVLIAQVAAKLVDGGTRLVADLGPLHTEAGLGPVLGIAFALAVIRLVLQVAVAYLPARIAADVQAKLRMDLFDAYNRASWSVQAEERDGDLQELLTTQNLYATQGASQAGQLVAAVLSFAALVTSALFLSAPVALVVIAAAWLLSFILRPLKHRGRRHGRELSAASLAYADGAGEAVRLAEETQVFGVGRAQRRRALGLADAARVAFLKNYFVTRLSQYLYQSFAILLIVGGLGGLYWSGTGRIAVLGSVVLMLVRGASYAQQAHTSYLVLQQTAPFLDRLLVAEARYRDAALPTGGRPLGTVRSIACDRVGYAYERGMPVLVDVSFEVDSGESVGIVGPSGAGKSTLVQILLRLRDPVSGDYLVNGAPAAELSRDDWHRRMAYVPQDPRLLHASVSDNIRFLRDLDDRAIERAARLAQVHDDIASWPAGYGTVIGQRADAVSGGQRQRICLARALAAEPDILVLDEPTSALDLRSESLIQESLAQLRGVLTLFVVSHRLSTLAACDRVMVLRSGRIEAFGSTAYLERTNAFYQVAVELTARPVS